MGFKIGDRIIVNIKDVPTFQGVKAVIINREEFRRARPGGYISNYSVLFKLDRAIENHRCWQTDHDDCSLLPRVGYND